VVALPYEAPERLRDALRHRHGRAYCLETLVVSCSVLGDAVRDALDPRLRAAR
jgi:hypothetical protein